ncbi:hypothetical protein [Mesorhizobium sp. ISC15]|uniref:hypothetical protein n=1 Tax=Mesorhizobium sp. ISC15 TaxID=3076429 RepID=UPI00301C9E4D
MRTRPTTWRLGISLLGSAAMLSQFGPARAQDGGNITVLDKILVDAESDEILLQDGYVAKKDRIGTKTDTPIVRIPQAVSVVTQKQIEDQKPRTLNESLGYTASANPTASASTPVMTPSSCVASKPSITACFAMGCASTMGHRHGSRRSLTASKASPS